MRILMVSLYFPPQITSNGVLMQELCERLRAFGHELTVITTHSTGENGAAGKGSSLGQAGWESGDRLRILRLRIPTFHGSESFAARAIGYFVFNCFSLIAGLLAGPQDAVFTLSPPLTNGVVSWLIGRLKGIPSIYNVQDLVPKAYVQFGVLKRHAVIALFEHLEKLVYQKNTRISVISDSFREHLLRKDVPREKIDVVPNFVDVERITILPRQNALSQRLGLNDPFVVMHAGSIAFRHGVEILVDVAQLLLDEPTILFLVVGDGSKRRAVEEKAREAGLPNFRMLPYLDPPDVPLLRACANVQMIVLRRGMTSHSVPSKVYEIMASGRPFVAAVDEGSTIWQLAREEECGLAVPPEDPKAMAAAIRKLYRDRHLARRLAENGRRHAVGRYSSKVIAERYDAIFRRLASPGRSV